MIVICDSPITNSFHNFQWNSPYLAFTIFDLDMQLYFLLIALWKYNIKLSPMARACHHLIKHNSCTIHNIYPVSNFERCNNDLWYISHNHLPLPPLPSQIVNLISSEFPSPFSHCDLWSCDLLSPWSHQTPPIITH